MNKELVNFDENAVIDHQEKLEKIRKLTNEYINTS